MSALGNVLTTWVKIPDLEVSRAYLEQHQAELLSNEAENVLQILAKAMDYPPTLMLHVRLLRKARSEGISAAYAQLMEDMARAMRLFDLFLIIPISPPSEMEKFIAQTPAMALDFLEMLLFDFLKSELPAELLAPASRRLEMLRYLRRRQMGV